VILSHYSNILEQAFHLEMSKTPAEVESKAAPSGSDVPDDVSEGAVAEVDGQIIDDGVRRVLKSRHLQMIALGGVIGPGTFYAMGFALRYSGPVGALIGYIIVGLDVFFVTQSLGEMATLFPSTGSFNEFAGRFVDPALSFALGWNYWYMWYEYNTVRDNNMMYDANVCQGHHPS
jgi:amino acid transporter